MVETKIIFIISSGESEKEKALTGLRMAINMKQKNRVSDVRILFFGPSQEMIAKGGEPIDDMLKEATEAGVYKTACVFIAKSKNISDSLISKNINLEPAGEVLANALKEGYVPITF
ncbi:MAG: hypothetical protein ACYCSO_06605 [Cuniculiplasma sp.]